MKIRRILSLLTALLLLCLSFASASAEETAPPLICGDYEYVLLPDGTAEVTLYRGQDADIVIPAELDGHPVTSVGAMGKNIRERYGWSANPGTYISVDDVAMLSQSDYHISRLREDPSAIRAARIEKYLPEDSREEMIRFLARWYAWEQGWKVITDINQVTGEPRDSEQYRAESVSYCQDRLATARADLEGVQAELGENPDWPPAKKKAWESQINILQAEIAEYEASIEKLSAAMILTDSEAKSRWTESTGITASLNNAESLFSVWQTAFESATENRDVPEGFNNGMDFMTSTDGLRFASADINRFHHLARDLQMISTGSDTESSGYVYLGDLARTFVVPPPFHSIVIPEGVTRIGESAFNGDPKLMAVTIPAGVTSIGRYTFSNCPALTEVQIPDGLVDIGDYAFSNCASLISIAVPASVTSIGPSAFTRNQNLTVTVIAGSYGEQYCRDNGIPFVYAEPQD